MTEPKDRPHVDLPAVMAGLEATIAEMRDLGRLEPIDEALVLTCRGICASVSADPTNASLWRQYLTALEQLRGLNVGVDDDEFDELTRSLSAPVRDEAPPGA